MKKISRRSFIANSSLAAAAVAVPMPADLEKVKKNIFIHHVYFWLKKPGNEADRAKLIEGLEGLSAVPSIKMCHIGTPAATDRGVIDRSYAISWLCFFKNKEEEEIYQKHPIHLNFVEKYAYLWEKVIVYDSEGPKR
ncbi:MAG TPA: Dabb family protein [Saprospiraceae bacterium]|nr:Dabb family protein [Saprospiraceae bacterium]